VGNLAIDRRPPISMVCHQRLMAVSVAEFVRLLRLLVVAPYQLNIDAGVAELVGNDQRIRIIFTPRPVRQLGRLSLPELAVCVEFQGDDSYEADRFMAGFDSGFHRGGG